LKPTFYHFKNKLIGRWKRIGIVRKVFEVLLLAILAFLTVPSNSVRLAIALSGHPQIARHTQVTKVGSVETQYLLGKYHIGRAYEINKTYLSWDGSYYVYAFHVTRIVLFNVAYSVPEPG